MEKEHIQPEIEHEDQPEAIKPTAAPGEDNHTDDENKQPSAGETPDSTSLPQDKEPGDQKPEEEGRRNGKAQRKRSV